jgi:hypothetical protein
MTTTRVAKWLVLSILAGGALLPQDAAEGEPSPDRAALEAAFAEKMSGATLLGRFTVDDVPDALPQAEAYRLGEVRKLEQGDDWRFESEIEYGDKKFNLPIVVQVKWAGDTPVITLTDMPVPLMGTFTARVVVYGDRYAGIWDGGDHGGQMFGRVVAGSEEAEADEGD